MEILQMNITDRVNKLILLFKNRTISNMNTEKLNYARKLCSEMEFAVTSFTEKIQDGNIICHAHLMERGGIIYDIAIFENIKKQLSKIVVAVENKNGFGDFEERARKLVFDFNQLQTLTLTVCNTSREVLQLQREERRRERELRERELRNELTTQTHTIT